MYLTSTRLDIMHGVSLISQYMENPTDNNLLVAKRIFHYLKGILDFGILYKVRTKENLFGVFFFFCYSDYAGDLEDKKSTLGFVFLMSSGVVYWSSMKQQVVTLSFIEVEFLATASSSCQPICLRRLLETLQHQ